MNNPSDSGDQPDRTAGAGIENVTICKHNFRGEYVFEWQGRVVSRDADTLVILAPWTRSPHQEGALLFEPGDLFLEYYYAAHPFSIWQVHGPDLNHHRGSTASETMGPLKGWYCNVCEPMNVQGDRLWFRDLILDLLVYPDGRYDLRDHDELIAARAAGLAATLAATAEDAIIELHRWISERHGPFSVLPAPS